ncbi:MAG: cytochrome c oxidase subunit II [Chthoniobacterales bacterium]
MILAITDAQYALAPAGEQATRIAHLWWIYFWVLSAIFVLVAIFLFLALLRRTHASEPIGTPPPEPRERRISGFVIGCVIATVVILFALLITDFFSGRAIYALGETDLHPENGDELEIKIIGHQWWWEVEYENQQQPSKMLTTANEVHVPVGRAVKLDLESHDVIHSFWVPNMHGKKDLVPGHPTYMWLRAEKPGTFRGQCAEFCGLQHAHMRLTFVADGPDAFSKWMSSASTDAPQPTTDSERRGQQVFMSNQCMMCHNINGTNARATVGPDLTHIASRDLLAGGAIPNTRGYLAGWIANPQNIKPGVRMPPNELASDDLNALVDYLETLK